MLGDKIQTVWVSLLTPCKFKEKHLVWICIPKKKKNPKPKTPSHWAAPGVSCKAVLSLAPLHRRYSAASGAALTPVSGRKGVKSARKTLLRRRFTSGIAALPHCFQWAPLQRSFWQNFLWSPASAVPQCECTQAFTLGLQLRLFSGAIFSAVVPEKRLQKGSKWS